jgi:hypothetical protein
METNLNPFAKSRKPFLGAGSTGLIRPNKKPRPVGRGFRSAYRALCKDYLAGAVDVSLEGFEDDDVEVDFLCFL